MKNIWSEHQRKAAKHAEWAASHYRRAAKYYLTGDTEKAIHHALMAVTQLDYTSQHARQANEYCFKAMMNNTFES
jgi:hypothetical protein